MTDKLDIASMRPMTEADWKALERKAQRNIKNGSTKLNRLKTQAEIAQEVGRGTH